jgi:hypothetical protein
MVVNHNLKIDPTDWITHESGIVAAAIVITRARRSIARSASFQCGFVEFLNLFNVCALVSYVLAQTENFDSLSAVNAVCCLLAISTAVASSISQPLTQK